MTNDEILNQLREKIRAEVHAELRAELIANLGGESAPARVARVAKTTKLVRPARRPAPGAKRSPAEIAKTASDVQTFVAAHPGTNAEAIKTALGVELNVIELPIKKLLASKQISRKGHKRATRYYPKTRKAA